MSRSSPLLAMLLLGAAAAGAAGETPEQKLARLEEEVAALHEENVALKERLAEVPAPPTPAASPEPPATAPSAPPPPTKITLGGHVRLRTEYRDHLLRGSADGDALVFQRARATLGVTAPRVRGLIEVQDARIWGGERSTTSNEGNIDLHQAFITLPGLGADGLSATLGRQELAFGDERLIGALDWSTVGRSFDGGRAKYDWGRGSVDAFAALVDDRRSMLRGDGDVVLSGAYGRLWRGSAGGEGDLYVIHLGDGAPVAGELGSIGTTRVTTLGARVRRAPAAGLSLSAEGAWQTGHRGPDRHRAHALALAAGYSWAGGWRPGVRLGWDAASGDGEADGRSREFHNLFPTNHAFYGYMDLLGWRNMSAWRATVSMAPRPGHALSVDGHRFRLREAGGPWKDAAGNVLGFDRSGSSGRDVGHELDVAYRLPVREDVALLLGYSVFFPGRFAERTRDTATQSFVYAQALFRF